MPTRPPLHRPAGARTKAQRDAEADKRRGNFRQRGYTAEWDKARTDFLVAHPHCVMCRRAGVTKPANVVDHITPHRGDKTLMWDRRNWQPLCSRHHNSGKQREERSAQRPIAARPEWI